MQSFNKILRFDAKTRLLFNNLGNIEHLNKNFLNPLKILIIGNQDNFWDDEVLTKDNISCRTRTCLILPTFSLLKIMLII